eukprot:9491913-Pyramimonas_sp.AAC.2
MLMRFFASAASSLMGSFSLGVFAFLGFSLPPAASSPAGCAAAASAPALPAAAGAAFLAASSAAAVVAATAAPSCCAASPAVTVSELGLVPAVTGSWLG